MADTVHLWPLNDLSVPMGPFETVSSLGAKAPITAGTISGFIATTATPDAVTAHANFVVANLSYVGGQANPNGGTYALGTWLFQLDASLLTDALCEQYFAATGEAFIHAISANNIRVVVRLEYQRTRFAVMI